MRPLPLLLLALVAIATLGLGFRVLQGAGTTPTVDGPPKVAEVGGVPQGHVYTGCADEPTDVNPFTAAGMVAQRLVLAFTHEGLLAADPWTGELQPMVAERFEPSADGSTCTFTLRAGLRFADGALVTLDDVLFGWELAKAGHLPMGFVGDAFARVAGVERLDDRSFCVRFRDAHYAVLRVVGESWLVAQKKFFVERVAARCRPEPMPAVDTAEFAMRLAQVDHECGPGTGPYRLDNDPAGVSNWRPHQDLLLVASEHCWRRQASPGTWNFAGLRVLFRQQGVAATNALLRGELDWFSSPMLDSLLREQPQLQQDYQRLLYDYDALGVYRVVWNCRRAPGDDPKVRRALGMLFDIDGLRQGNEGLGPRAVAHAKPGSAAYPTDVEPLPYDPGAARRLLREAGYDPEQGKPLRLVVIAMQGTDVLRRMCDSLEAAAKQAGIELDLRRRDPGPFASEKKAGEWHGLLAQQRFKAWGDPWDLVHSMGDDNDGGYANDEVDRLADEARIEPDADKRAALWRELHTIVYREQPVALLVHPLASLLLHRRIEGAKPGRSGLVIERAFVPAGQQRK